MHYSILYRGPLSSCNYGCEYCPFAKRWEEPDELKADAAALSRFVEWAAGQASRGHELSILFTPWGEALVRRWYREAIVALTSMSHIRRVAVQTNLSCRLDDWVPRCDPAKLGLWCTYHPGETTRERFLSRCTELKSFGTRFSVGVVGMKAHVDEIAALRAELPTDTYLWVNAYKRQLDYYDHDELQRLSEVDPLFPVNNTRHASQGKLCLTGHSVFSVDGEGTIRRCHFIKAPLGSIYAQNWEAALAPKASPCTNETCGCHIGYVHLEGLRLYETFGSGVLERIPEPRIPDPQGPVPAVARTVSLAVITPAQVSANG